MFSLLSSKQIPKLIPIIMNISSSFASSYPSSNIFSLFNSKCKWYWYKRSYSLSQGKSLGRRFFISDFREEDIPAREQGGVTLAKKLLTTLTSKKVLDIFEHEVLYKPQPETSGENLCLILFYVAKHMTDISHDPRIITLLDMVLEKIPNLSFDYITTTLWAISILCAHMGMKMDVNDKLDLLKLVDKMPKDRYNTIPPTCLALTMIFHLENEVEVLKEVITKLTTTYLEKNKVNLDLTGVMAFFTSFSSMRLNSSNILLDQISEQCIKYKLFDSEDCDEEIINLIVAMYRLEYVHELLAKYVYQKFISKIGVFDLPSLSHATIALGRLFPGRRYLLEGYIKELTSKLKEDTSGLDISLYIGLWTSVGLFGIKKSVDPNAPFFNALMAYATKNDNWCMLDLDKQEIFEIAMAIGLTNIDNSKFMMGICSILSDMLPQYDNEDLINLARITFYFRKYESTRDIYKMIHDHSVDKKHAFNDDERDQLVDIYTEHAVFNDSPFVKVKMQRIK